MGTLDSVMDSLSLSNLPHSEERMLCNHASLGVYFCQILTMITSAINLVILLLKEMPLKIDSSIVVYDFWYRFYTIECETFYLTPRTLLETLVLE